MKVKPSRQDCSTAAALYWLSIIFNNLKSFVLKLTEKTIFMGRIGVNIVILAILSVLRHVFLSEVIPKPE